MMQKCNSLAIEFNTNVSIRNKRKLSLMPVQTVLTVGEIKLKTLNKTSKTKEDSGEEEADGSVILLSLSLPLFSINHPSSLPLFI